MEVVVKLNSKKVNKILIPNIFLSVYLLLKNDNQDQASSLKKVNKYRKQIAFDILLIGGPSNNLTDCEVCFQCGHGVVEMSVKLTNFKRNTWLLFF